MLTVPAPTADPVGRSTVDGAMEPITRTAKTPSVGMSVTMRLIPGVRRVHDTIVPFARAWDQWNAEALRASGPLWVALGDSMSQGIGASDITGGWVGQLYSRLAASEAPMRLVNLSTTGARVRDVLGTQLAQLRELGVEPDLVTVLVGANDMLRRSRRDAAVGGFRQLLGELPAGRSVVATLPRRNPQSLAIDAMIDSAAAAGLVRIAEMRTRTVPTLRGTLADDYFHPNEVGYRSIADRFAAVLR